MSSAEPTSIAKSVRRLDAFFFAGVDPVRLDTFRRCLAVTFLVYMAYWFTNAPEWLTDYGFHYTPESERAYYPDPWPTMAPTAIPIFGVLLFGSTIGLIAGYRVRLLSWVLLACAVYVQRVDSISAFTINKLYIVAFAVLAVSPSPREVRLTTGEVRLLQSAWPIRVLQMTLLIQYFTAGMCKVLHGDWLQNPDVLWTQVQGVFRTHFAALLLNNLPQWVWSVMMYFALAFELLSPVLFTVRRLLPLGILWGISFQLMIALTMEKLIFFSLQLVSFYVLFLQPDTLHRLRCLFRTA